MLNVSWEEVVAVEVVVLVAAEEEALLMEGVYPGRVCTWVAVGSCWWWVVPPRGLSAGCRDGESLEDRRCWCG